MSKIFLEIDGVDYEGFTDNAVESSLENFSSSFSFSTTQKETRLGVLVNDLKLQQKVRVKIDSTVVITGYIEQLDISYSANSHSISVSGRDVGGDMIDSSMVPKSYKQRNFEALCNLVLADNGFSSVLVKNKVGVLTLDPTEIIKIEAGESVFDFLDRYAKKLQVLLKIDASGNLNILREDDEVVKNLLINDGTQSTNILAAQLNLSTQDRFNSIQVFSQADNSTHTKTGISQKGAAQDGVIRKTRRKILSMDTASQNASLKTLAEWNVNLRRAKGSRYSCKVIGFYSSNKTLWQPNKLVDIIDNTCQIQGTFLIQGVKFDQSLSGSFTTLEIVESGAFGLGAIKKSGFADQLILSN